MGKKECSSNHHGNEKPGKLARKHRGEKGECRETRPGRPANSSLNYPVIAKKKMGRGRKCRVKKKNRGSGMTIKKQSKILQNY